MKMVIFHSCVSLPEGSHKKWTWVMVAIFCTRSNHEADLVGNRSIGWERKVDLRFRKWRFPKSWGYSPNHSFSCRILQTIQLSGIPQLWKPPNLMVGRLVVLKSSSWLRICWLPQVTSPYRVARCWLQSDFFSSLMILIICLKHVFRWFSMNFRCILITTNRFSSYVFFFDVAWLWHLRNIATYCNYLLAISLWYSSIHLHVETRFFIHLI